MSEFEKQLEAKVIELFNKFLLNQISYEQVINSFDYINWKANYSIKGRVKSHLKGSAEVTMLENTKDLLLILDKLYFDKNVNIEPIIDQYNSIVMSKGRQ